MGAFEVTTLPYVCSVTLVGTPPANGTSIDFLVTFSEPVQPVDITDFTLTPTGRILTPPAITGVAGGGYAWTVSVNTGRMEGTIAVNVADANRTIRDDESNALAALGSSSPANVDTIPPQLLSISPVNPGAWQTPSGPTNDPAVTFSVVFNESIGVFDPAAITVTGGGNGAVLTPVDSGDHKTWNVPVTGITGDDDLTITVNTGSSVLDLAGNSLAVSGTSSPVVHIDNTPPTPVLSGSTAPARTTRTLTIDFGEVVDTFALGKITVTNGVASNLILQVPHPRILSISGVPTRERCRSRSRPES